VLLIEGNHVPVMPLLDVLGNVNVPPLHMAEICVNVGVTIGFTVTTKFVLHPSLLVNVIVEVPALNPTTRPLETVAILGLLETQALLGAGVPLPISCVLLPTQTKF
jgi:hypothetical protein